MQRGRITEFDSYLLELFLCSVNSDSRANKWYNKLYLYKVDRNASAKLKKVIRLKEI